MVDGALRDTGGEEARICAGYRRRVNDQALYSWFNSGYLFFIHERERRVLRVLEQQGFLALGEK